MVSYNYIRNYAFWFYAQLSFFIIQFILYEKFEPTRREQIQKTVI